MKHLPVAFPIFGGSHTPEEMQGGSTCGDLEVLPVGQLPRSVARRSTSARRSAMNSSNLTRSILSLGAGESREPPACRRVGQNSVLVSWMPGGVRPEQRRHCNRYR